MPTVEEQIKITWNGYKNYIDSAATWQSKVADTTNIQIGGIGNAKQVVVNSFSSFAGIPQIAQVGNSMKESGVNSPKNQYAVSALGSYNDIPGIKYPDFRARKGLELIRLDGASAVTRGSVIAGIYAAASAAPTGPYAVFNLDGVGKTGFGLGDHDNPYALRRDFTAMSHVSTQWRGGKWKQTINPLALATPFRGDKVNVIDFGQRTRKNIYRWKPEALGMNLFDKFGITQDFIKFYFTGPKLANGASEAETDDVMVFRAIINSLSDTFSPNWAPQTMIGRADPNYHYTGYGRDLQLDFAVYASDRDELKPIFRKLNALAGYTAPEYDMTTIAMKAPWMRITIGDLFVHQPAIITSLSYTLIDSDTTWEINIEQDPEMMQVPHKVSVSLGLTPIMDYLPQKNGRFYTLADEKMLNVSTDPKKGNRNWLSDSLGNLEATSISENQQSGLAAATNFLKNGR